jgi:predicted ATPase
MLRQLHLSNFKCFNQHTVTFEQTTVLVGKNNAGKSTIVEALHLVGAVANRKAASFVHPPRWADLPKFQLGIAPSLAHLDMDLRKVFHRYGEPPAVIAASFEAGVKVTVYLGPEETAYATVENQRDWVRTSGKFAALCIPWIYILPQVAPIPENEPVLTDNYVSEHLYTRLSSRHFRNQVFRRPDSFKEFKELAEASWHGLRVKPVERVLTNKGPTLSMFVQDGDFVAEIASMGHGLQMWLQTVWFVSRTPTDGIVVLDEPDVYMHPDLQRKVFRLIKRRFRQSVVATHSVEIMAEADPGQILIADKSRPKSVFANTEPAVQSLVDQLGGIHNVHLARLWSAKKFLLVEGKDVSFLRHFHSLLFPEAEIPIDAIPSLPVGGWGGWAYALGSSMTLRNAVGDRVMVYCILDSDFHTSKQIEDRYQEAKARGVRLHVWSRKELENYLVHPRVIKRTIAARLKAEEPPTEEEIDAEICRICEFEKDTVAQGIAAEIMAEDRKLGAGAFKIALERVAALWKDPQGPARVVSGKQNWGNCLIGLNATTASHLERADCVGGSHRET